MWARLPQHSAVIMGPSVPNPEPQTLKGKSWVLLGVLLLGGASSPIYAHEQSPNHAMAGAQYLMGLGFRVKGYLGFSFLSGKHATIGYLHKDGDRTETLAAMPQIPSAVKK